MRARAQHRRVEAPPERGRPMCASVDGGDAPRSAMRSRDVRSARVIRADVPPPRAERRSRSDELAPLTSGTAMTAASARHPQLEVARAPPWRRPARRSATRSRRWPGDHPPRAPAVGPRRRRHQPTAVIGTLSATRPGHRWLRPGTPVHSRRRSAARCSHEPASHCVAHDRRNGVCVDGGGAQRQRDDAAHAWPGRVRRAVGDEVLRPPRAEGRRRCALGCSTCSTPACRDRSRWSPLRPVPARARC